MSDHKPLTPAFPTQINKDDALTMTVYVRSGKVRELILKRPGERYDPVVIGKRIALATKTWK
jgi:hypothetical protein